VGDTSAIQSFTLKIAALSLMSVWSLQSDWLPLQAPGERKNVCSSTKMPSASGGLRPPDHHRGLCPLDPRWGSAPRPPLYARAPALAIAVHPSAPPTSNYTCDAPEHTVSVYVTVHAVLAGRAAANAVTVPPTALGSQCNYRFCRFSASQTRICFVFYCVFSVFVCSIQLHSCHISIN